MKSLIKLVWRNPRALVVNVTGLALGLAAAVLLSTFVLFELSYDRQFSKGDRILFLSNTWIEEGKHMHMPITLREACTELPLEVAGIEAACQIYRGFSVELQRGEDRFKEMELLYATGRFFELFDLPLLEGSAGGTLDGPGLAVLTLQSAEKIFGRLNVVGESFQMDGESYMVSGVVQDLPPNIHFSFDVLMSMQSVKDLEQLGGLEFFSYFLLSPEVDQELVGEQIRRTNTRILEERFGGFGGASFSSATCPLRDLHLRSGLTWGLSTPGNPGVIRLMGIITLAVLLLALSNFINLYLLDAARRSREIGVRKVVGVSRRGLIRQFYLETTIVVSMAFLLAAVLAFFLLPSFARLMQRDSFMEVTTTPGLYLVLIGVYVLTIVLSGFYPALLLSKAAPVLLLRSVVNPAGDKRILIRGVSIAQLVIALGLMSILLGINAQTRFMQRLDMGYKEENIALVYNLNEGLRNNYESIRERLLMVPGVEKVGASSHTIGQGYSGQGILMYGEAPENGKSIAEYRILPGLSELYEFRLVAGRFLDREIEGDRLRVLVNEKAVEMLGYEPGEIIGEQVLMHQDPLEVAGVLRDFHFEAANELIQPLVLTAYSNFLRVIAIRHSEGIDVGALLKDVDEVLRGFDPEYVMVHNFAASICGRYYQTERRLQRILFYGSVFALLIVMLGIYALVSHNLLSRNKEIGIRKVQGASTAQIVRLLYLSSLKWTLLAAMIAMPLAWLFLSNWLEDYPLRISLSWWLFALALLLVGMVQSLITLGLSYDKARRRPVECLRYE